MKKEYSYYTVDEFIIALSTLNKTDKKKLLLFGIKYCRDYSLECEGIDLYQEAITRLLSGSRRAAKEIISMIELIGDGLKAKEITNIMFNGDRKKYDTTYKRFMRNRKLIHKEAEGV